MKIILIFDIGRGLGRNLSIDHCIILCTFDCRVTDSVYARCRVGGLFESSIMILPTDTRGLPEKGHVIKELVV